MPGERILIVDDELPIRMALKTAFLREGMVPQEASCGSQALEMIRSQTFDLVVLDIMMQDMDGYTILQNMRAEGNTTPVLLLSGRQDEVDQVLGLGLGADDYLTKPFRLSVLTQKVKALIRRSSVYNQQRRNLNRQVWNEHVVDDNTIMVYIKRIREKIEEDSRNPVYLRTVRGIGYIFNDKE